MIVCGLDVLIALSFVLYCDYCLLVLWVLVGDGLFVVELSCWFGLLMI